MHEEGEESEKVSIDFFLSSTCHIFTLIMFDEKRRKLWIHRNYIINAFGWVLLDNSIKQTGNSPK